jgi:hypothetical protein
VKILLVQIAIEQNKLDLADAMIESLRKYFTRIKSQVNSTRIEITIILLGKLSRNSYNFKMVYNSNIDLINELVDQVRHFDFGDFNMILFHEWLHAKVKGIPYDHVEVMTKLKRLNKQKHQYA